MKGSALLSSGAGETVSASRLGSRTVRSVETGQVVPLESFWEEQACVITFLRRFGCQFCRLGALRLDALAPLLREQGMRLIGVGPEELGATEFLEGHFFTGELYIDETKQCYKEIGCKRLGVCGLFSALISRQTREHYKASKAIGGNLKGDGMQLGGTIVVAKGGKLLFTHVQQEPADYVDNGDILEAVGLPRTAAEDLPLPLHDIGGGGCGNGSCQA